MEKIINNDINDIAKEFGTPIYVYDEEKIRHNYLILRDTFTKYYPDTHIHYSVKANSNLHILKIFNELGSGADCSSPVEFMLSQKAGFPDDKILYTGNYESIEDFEALKGAGIKINLDDINSFKRLLRVFTPERISFRINPGIGRGGFEGIVTAGSDAKFGVPYEKAYEAYKLAKDAGIKRFGIHMMTGSNNLEPYYFAEIVDKLLTITGKQLQELDIIPEYIDIGGGLGIPYEDYEEELDIEKAAKLVTETFNERCEKFGFKKPSLILEPGRYLVANAGYLVTKVTGIKKSYKTFAGLDAGMNTLIRPALYGAKHRVSVYNKDSNQEFVTLCGRICENSDIFAQHALLPKLEENDLLIFRDAGAYGYVMSSVYNGRLRPAEVLVNKSGARLIKKAESFDDIMDLYPG